MRLQITICPLLSVEDYLFLHFCDYSVKRQLLFWSNWRFISLEYFMSPYRKGWMNIADGLFFTIFGVFLLLKALGDHASFTIGFAMRLSISAVTVLCIGYKCLKRFCSCTWTHCNCFELLQLSIVTNKSERINISFIIANFHLYSWFFYACACRWDCQACPMHIINIYEIHDKLYATNHSTDEDNQGTDL